MGGHDAISQGPGDGIPAGADDETNLGAAWQATQAHLPDGWRLESIRCASEGLDPAARSDDWVAVAIGPDGEERRARAADPIDALASLAADLAPPGAAVDPPLALDAFVDFHCPFSYRLVAWLDDLGPERVAVRHHYVAIEQLNRDPDAAEWRLWEQPLDYRHWKDQPDRRPLLAFLAMAAVEAGQPAPVARAFRLSLYMSKWDFGRDLSTIEVIERAGEMGGVASGWIRHALEDPDAQTAARSRIEADHRQARAHYSVFGVPTIQLEGDRPVYLRLGAMVRLEDAPTLLETVRQVRASPAPILEMKLPEPAGPPPPFATPLPPVR